MTAPTALTGPSGPSPEPMPLDAAAGDDGAARRTFHRASLVGGLVAMVVLAWLATRGASTLFDRPPLGGVFDAQARSLFHGRWDIPSDAVSFERFNIDGRFYTYFGPTPSLLRMPILVFTDAFDGRLSRVSMILACAVLVLAVARLSWLARRTVRGNLPVSRAEAVVAGGVVLVAACGTVTPYVAGWTAVYHEAIQWGVAWALVSYGALVAWLLDGRRRDLAVAGVAAALSVSARGSVGLGPIAAIGLVLAAQLWVTIRDRRRDAAAAIEWRRLAGLGAAALVPIALYGYVNAAKFGAPFAAPPFAEQDLLVRWPPRVAALAANGGNLFGWHYAPTALFHYLRPDGIAFDRLFPWVLPRIPTRVFGDAVFENLRPTASTTSTAPLAVLAAAVGGWCAVSRGHVRRIWLAPIVGAAVGVAGSLGVAFLDHRYQADIVPLLVVAGVVGVWAAVEWLSGRSRRLVVAVVVATSVLGIWSVWTNLAVAFVYQRAQPDWSTVEDRASLVKAQLSIQDAVGGLPSRVGAGDALPEDGEAANLFVLGDCDGVYRHDGVSWLAVEQTPATGFHRLAVDVDPAASARQPVLSSVDEVGTTVIWARARSDGRVAFEYQWEPLDARDGFRARVPLGAVDRMADGTVELTARLDPREGISDFLQVRAGGRLLYEDIVTKVREPFEVGVQHTLPGATSLSGVVRARNVATPLCDRLVRMGLHVG